MVDIESPGEGAPMIEQQLTFRYDWEGDITSFLDYLQTRPVVDGDKLTGMSPEYHLVALAVDFVYRIRAAVFFDRGSTRSLD